MEIYSDFSKIMDLTKSDSKLNIEFLDNKNKPTSNKLCNRVESIFNMLNDNDVSTDSNYKSKKPSYQHKKFGRILVDENISETSSEMNEPYGKVYRKSTNISFNEKSNPFENEYGRSTKNLFVEESNPHENESGKITENLINEKTSPFGNEPGETTENLINEETSPYENMNKPNPYKVMTYEKNPYKVMTYEQTNPYEYNENTYDENETNPQMINNPLSEQQNSVNEESNETKSIESSFKKIWNNAKSYLNMIKQEGGNDQNQGYTITSSGNITMAPKSDDGLNGPPRFKENTSEYVGNSTNGNNMFSSNFRNNSGHNYPMTSTYNDDENNFIKPYTGINKKNSANYDTDYSFKNFSNNNNIKQFNKSSYLGKRQLPPKLLAMITLAKELLSKFSSKYPQFKYKNWVAISKTIWDDAERESSGGDINVVRAKAQELIKNADKYINKYINNK